MATFSDEALVALSFSLAHATIRDKSPMRDSGTPYMDE